MFVASSALSYGKVAIGRYLGRTCTSLAAGGFLLKLVFLNIIRYRNDECLQVHVFVIVTPESPHLVLYLILIGYYMYLPYPGTHNIRHHPITNSLLFASRRLAGSRACRSTSVVVVDILRPLVYL